MQLPIGLVYGKSFKGLLAEYVKSLNKGEARWRLCLFLGKVERQDTYVLRDGVQVVLSKCVRRTDQDWSEYSPTYKRFNALSREYQTNFGGSVVAAERKAGALPAAQTDISRERVLVKFKDEDAGAVMAKPLEGGSGSEKEEPLFPEPLCRAGNPG